VLVSSASAAAAINCVRKSRAASLTALPITVVERLAPVERSKGVARVSVPRMITDSIGTSSSRATIWLRIVRAP
jgi:hypothetical protein